MRSRRRKIGFEYLIEMPWWISLGLAIIVDISLLWVIPNKFSTSSILNGLIPTITGFAWVLTGLFLFTAICSVYMRDVDKNDWNDS